MYGALDVSEFGIGYSSAPCADVRAAKPGTTWSYTPSGYIKLATSLVYHSVFVAAPTNTTVFTRISDLAEILTKCGVSAVQLDTLGLTSDLALDRAMALQI